MSEAQDNAGQVHADHGEDRRTNAEQLIDDQLVAASRAMNRVADYIAADDLPWTDVKIMMLGSRTDNILSDLDHMMMRVREQPPYPPKLPIPEFPSKARPAEQAEAIEST